MGKNIKGGKNYKKQKKNSSISHVFNFKNDDQYYARIIKSFGDGRFNCQIFNIDNETNVICKITGSMRNKVWIKLGDIVIISSRGIIGTQIYDILHKYNDEEAKCLKEYGEIPLNINLMATDIELINEDDVFNHEDICVDFADI